MARIDYVRQRLENWSRWARSSADGGLGYYSASALTRIGMPRTVSHTSVATDLDAECSETQRAVQSLLPSHFTLWGTLQAYYVKGFDIARCARLMHCAESSIKARLCRADQVLDLWFVAQAEVVQRARMNKEP